MPNCEIAKRARAAWRLLRKIKLDCANNKENAYYVITKNAVFFIYNSNCWCGSGGCGSGECRLRGEQFVRKFEDAKKRIMEDLVVHVRACVYTGGMILIPGRNLCNFCQCVLKCNVLYFN